MNNLLTHCKTQIVTNLQIRRLYFGPEKSLNHKTAQSHQHRRFKNASPEKICKRSRKTPAQQIS